MVLIQLLLTFPEYILWIPPPPLPVILSQHGRRIIHLSFSHHDKRICKTGITLTSPHSASCSILLHCPNTDCIPLSTSSPWNAEPGSVNGGEYCKGVLAWCQLL